MFSIPFEMLALTLDLKVSLPLLEVALIIDRFKFNFNSVFERLTRSKLFQILSFCMQLVTFYVFVFILVCSV